MRKRRHALVLWTHNLPAIEELTGRTTPPCLARVQHNPHTPHPAREPDSPLSDVMELRDLLAPSKPVVAMFPVGVGCGATVDGLGSGESGGIFGLPESAGVFQIGTK